MTHAVTTSFSNQCEGFFLTSLTSQKKVHCNSTTTLDDKRLTLHTKDELLFSECWTTNWQILSKWKKDDLLACGHVRRVTYSGRIFIKSCYIHGDSTNVQGCTTKSLWLSLPQKQVNATFKFLGMFYCWFSTLHRWLTLKYMSLSIPPYLHIPC